MKSKNIYRVETYAEQITGMLTFYSVEAGSVDEAIRKARGVMDKKYEHIRSVIFVCRIDG